MKTLLIIAMIGIASGCATPSPRGRVPLKQTVFRPLADKPATQVDLGPADAELYWRAILPSHLAALPAATNEWLNMKAIDMIDVPQGMSREVYGRLMKDLDEFKRTRAHRFWEPYRGKTITVQGGHYCTCCFHAAIGRMGRGYSGGWTIRLDTYIAIGLPEGSTCYTVTGEPVGMKCPLLPLSPLVHAVGVVAGPHAITADLAVGGSQAQAYFVLQQLNNGTSNKPSQHTVDSRADASANGW